MTSIADLWQGHSNQPAWKRHPGQVDEARNFTLDVTEGARKRNATNLVADIAGTVLDTGTEYYIVTLREFRVFIADSSITVLDNEGNQITVTDSTTAGGFAYLSGVSRADIDTALSIDTIIILNRLKVVEMEATETYEVLGEVQVFSELFEAPSDPEEPDPTTAQPGDHWRVITDENLDPAGYYERTSTGWERVAASGDTTGRAKRDTWPHRLVYQPSTNTFVFDEIPFNDRLSGNEVTNRVFPFVNQTLQAVEFLSSRLFFIGRDSINSTRASDVFSIFAFNVNNITDDDRISKDITQKNVGLPLRAATLGEGMLLICENGQLAFGSADEALTVLNGRIRQIKDFKSLDLAPGTDGNRLTMMDSFKQTRVFAWSESARTIEYMGSTSEHVTGVFDDYDIAGIWLSNDTTFVTTSTEEVWVHDMYFAGGELRQSAWSIYALNEPVQYIDSWEDQIRLVTLGSTWTLMRYLHRKPIAPTEMDFDPRLDRRVLLSGTYIPKDDETEFELEGRNADADLCWVVTTKDPLGEDSQEFLRPVSVNGRKLRIRGKWTGYEHYVGWNYEARLKLSKLYNGASDTRPMTSNFNVFHVDTTNYTIEVGRERGQKRTIDWPSNYLDVQRLNESQVLTGHSSHLLIGDARNTSITIINDTPGTCTISAVDYVGATRGRS